MFAVDNLQASLNLPSIGACKSTERVPGGLGRVPKSEASLFLVSQVLGSHGIPRRRPPTPNPEPGSSSLSLSGSQRRMLESKRMKGPQAGHRWLLRSRTGPSRTHTPEIRPKSRLPCGKGEAVEATPSPTPWDSMERSTRRPDNGARPLRDPLLWSLTTQPLGPRLSGSQVRWHCGSLPKP